MNYTFDIAYDCPLHIFLEMLENYNLTLISFTAIGPGGGNPEITVSGTPDNIDLLKEELGVE